jgi:hypothetical protein
MSLALYWPSEATASTAQVPPVPQWSLTIRDFPTDPIEVECKMCGRNGRYRKAGLIEKYGNNIRLPDLLALLAGDCDKRTALGNQGCGAIYPALSRAQKRNPPLEFR